MAKVLVKQADKVVDSASLTWGALSIGRASDNALQLACPTVSGHHAKIFSDYDAIYTEDLKSTNVTCMNGKRIEKHTLRLGDVIRLGEYELVIEDN